MTTLKDRGYLLGLCGILLLSPALLFASIPGRSLWIDEWFTVTVASERSVSTVIQHAIQTERRPPLHYLALHVWNALAGSGETSQRTFAVLCFVLALPVVFAIGRRLAGRPAAFLATAMIAFSPFLLLYAPMVRAYSFTLLVGSVATLAFLHWRDDAGVLSGLGYVLAGLALAYSDYAGLGLLMAHAIVAAIDARRLGAAPQDSAPGGGSAERLPRGALIAYVVIAAAYVPWIGVVVSQSQRPALPADFAHGVAGFALKIAYPLYSLALGETIFPWHPAALAGLAVMIVAAFSAWRFWDNSRRQALTLGILLAAPLAFVVFVLSTFATDITFLNVASRSALAAPYFYILMAGGLARLQRLLLPILGVLAISWTFGIANLFSATDFHNPIYAVPVREISQEISREMRKGDVVVADPDSVLAYYLPDRSGFSVLSSMEPTTLEHLQSIGLGRVWLLTLGRDRTRELEPVALVQWLENEFRLARSIGYVPQEAFYSRVKQRLLGREGYEYKALLRVYERR